MTLCVTLATLYAMYLVLRCKQWLHRSEDFISVPERDRQVCISYHNNNFYFFFQKKHGSPPSLSFFASIFFLGGAFNPQASERCMLTLVLALFPLTGCVRACLRACVRVCVLLHRPQTFQDIGRELLGKTGEKIIIVFVVLMQLGICTVFFNYAAENIIAVERTFPRVLEHAPS